MTTIEFVVLGVPVPKGRPRVVRNRGNAPRAITPDKTRRYEESVRYEAHRAMAGIGPLQGPLTVSIVCRFPPQLDWPAWKLEILRAADRMIVHTRKPDLDNIVKSVLDGCAGVVFRDDGQVCKLNAMKAYSAGSPRVTITVDRFEGIHESTKRKEVTK